jgi:uncharacterized membrane protein YphA (DoxX/SURF4 family)
LFFAILKQSMMNKRITQHLPFLFLRFALAATLLSAVADRFGWWGTNSAWGNWQNFQAYTRQLTFFLPQSTSLVCGYVATFLEIVLASLLLTGFKTRYVATCTGLLLLLFALAMSISLGIKSALDYSVWVGSAASFLLAHNMRSRSS